MTATYTAPFVLLVEDDVEQRLLLEEVLSTLAVEVVTAGSVVEALEVLASRGTVDLVVADYVLSDGFADELLIRGGLSPDRVILISGRGPAEIGVEAEFLRKPFELEGFLASVRAKLGLDESVLPSVVGVTPQAATDDSFALRLYVAGDDDVSRRAYANAQRIIAASTRDVTLTRIDMRDHQTVDAADRVLFTPTLVRVSPPPRAWVVGDLADSRPLLALLGLSS
ncbi:MAG: circadian clock KaiB family protein [Myxococcota bacterium]